MNLYQFGNHICALREELGMTQTELSRKLDVSDKTISKWENGQAFPRIETFERLAQVLGTTMEEILTASRDGVRRVCFVNSYCPVLQLEVNGELHALHHEECKWVAVESDEIILKVRGDGEPVLTPPAAPNAEKGKKIWNKLLRFTEKLGNDMGVKAECTYRLTGVGEDSILTVSPDTVEFIDWAFLFPPFNTQYPKIEAAGVGVELLQAKALNRRDAISNYKKWGLVWCFDDDALLFLPLLLPFLGLAARYHCRSRVMEKRIRNADAIRERERKHNEKWGKWYIGAALLIVLGILIMVAIGF